MGWGPVEVGAAEFEEVATARTDYGEVLGKFAGGKGDDPSAWEWRVMIDEWRVGGGGAARLRQTGLCHQREERGKMRLYNIGIGERSPARPCHSRESCPHRAVQRVTLTVEQGRKSEPCEVSIGSATASAETVSERQDRVHCLLSGSQAHVTSRRRSSRTARPPSIASTIIDRNLRRIQ